MQEMEHIERATRSYAEARDCLLDRVSACTDEQEAVAKRHLKGIKAAVRVCLDRLAELRTEIGERTHLFTRPRTATFHGIKIGIRKQPGEVEYDDEAQVVKLIRKHYPERFDELVITTEKPRCEALRRLSAAELARIGCRLTETGDAVVVKSVAKGVDKLVAALMKEHSQEDALVDAA